MKTKITLFLFVFMVSLVSQTFAQDEANSANQWWSESTFMGNVMVWCDGDVYDVLEGEVRIHYVSKRFDNGKLVMRTMEQLSGELTSPKTKEVFKFTGKIKWEVKIGGVWSCTLHYNMKGDKGTKYSGKIYGDFSNGAIFTELHANCH